MSRRFPPGPDLPLTPTARRRLDELGDEWDAMLLTDARQLAGLRRAQEVTEEHVETALLGRRLWIQRQPSGRLRELVLNVGGIMLALGLDKLTDELRRAPHPEAGFVVLWTSVVMVGLGTTVSIFARR
ncbi:MAG: hypothetical protein ACRDI2_00945 [Chloroflexota bacterium]